MLRRFLDWLFGLQRPPDDPTLEVGGYFDEPVCQDCGEPFDSTFHADFCLDEEDTEDYDPDHCEQCGCPLPDECFRFICDDCSGAEERGG